MAGGLKLYNTLTREKVDFEPIDPDTVRLYVCGPTVYDFAHIGNARPVIVFDVLYRLLRHTYGADKVTYVRNITDVDDKINARALRDFGGQIADGSMSLNEAIRAVTGKTESQFHEDVASLGCLKPTHEPRATDNILQMITIIQRLLDMGHAYVATGSEGHEVLFSTASMADYGMLSKRKLEDQQAGARVAVESHKMNPADFVLWKQSADTEPGWPASFTFEKTTTPIYGRPGWHIECSAMADRYLWEEIKDRLSPKAKAKPHQFDIHGGGLDLIFPHHENEIAQSCCAFDNDLMATVWMHNGFLQVEGRKMSKSEGNFVTINELLATEKFGGRKWPGEVLRLAMLMTHYREPIDFSVKRLEEAFNISRSWFTLLGNLEISDFRRAPSEGLMEQLADDLNTPAAISHIVRQQTYAHSSVEALKQLGADIAFLGLAALKVQQIRDLPPITATANIFEDDDVVAAPATVKNLLSEINEMEIENQISKRATFLSNGEYSEADKIRDYLRTRGVQLKDSKDPVTKERVTTWEITR